MIIIKKVFLVIICLPIFTGCLSSKDQIRNDHSVWPDGKKAAVVLTYDDSLMSHLDVAIPQLDAAGLVGTFYLTIAQESMIDRLDEWRAAAKKGHELGNHTIHHPCQKDKADRSWVQEYQNLDNYTHWQFLQELLAVDVALKAIDGETERTFAYPCVDTIVGGKSIVSQLRLKFIGSRSMSPSGILNPASFDPHLLPSLNVAGKTGAELIEIVEAALPNNPQSHGNAIILMFHGVGGDHLSVTSEAHQALVKYLQANRDHFWVTSAKELLLHLDKVDPQGG